MAKSSPRQRRIEGRVMHEFKHGELRSGPRGKGGKVKSRRQAIAIALSEAGASKYQSEPENRRSRRKTERKEARGQTYQQEREGKSHVGARASARAAARWAARTRGAGRRAEPGRLARGRAAADPRSRNSTAAPNARASEAAQR
jgi:hypothetical protein